MPNRNSSPTYRWDTPFTRLRKENSFGEFVKLAGLTIAAGLLLAACGTEEAKIEQDVKKEEQKEKVKAFHAEKKQEDKKVTVQQSTDKSKQHENVAKETVKEEPKAESTPVEQPKVSGLNEAQAQEKVEQSKTAQGQVASFGTMGLYVDLKAPSKDYLGEYWENFSGDIGIYDSNEKQLVRGNISKLNPTKINW